MLKINFWSLIRMLCSVYIVCETTWSGSITNRIGTSLLHTETCSLVWLLQSNTYLLLSCDGSEPLSQSHTELFGHTKPVEADHLWQKITCRNSMFTVLPPGSLCFCVDETHPELDPEPAGWAAAETPPQSFSAPVKPPPTIQPVCTSRAAHLHWRTAAEERLDAVLQTPHALRNLTTHRGLKMYL